MILFKNLKIKKSKSPYTFECAIYRGVLAHFLNFCNLDMLSKMSYLSRYWSEQTAEHRSPYAYKRLILNNQKINEYNLNTSSQWHFTDLKYLNIRTWNYKLESSKFPKFQQQTVQYLNSNSFHFESYLPNLRALVVWGWDDRTPLDDEVIKQWKLQKSKQIHPIKLTVITLLYLGHYYNDFIPKSKSILFTNSNVTGKLLTDYLSDTSTMWIGMETYQYGGIIKPFYNDNTAASDAEINKVMPTKHFNLAYCYEWDYLTRVFKSGACFDKNVSVLRVLFRQYDMGYDIRNFLQCIIDVKNCNKPKEIVLLCHHEGPLINELKRAPFEERDNYLFGFVVDNFDNIKNNVNISRFVLGIMRTHKKFKSGHCFDLKKLPSNADHISHYCKWCKILYLEENVQVSGDWECEYQQFMDSIDTA